MNAKLDVVAKYNPAGIALWRLGQEQPEIWNAITAKYPKQ
jgi:spore germination protein YaaH